MKINEKLYVKYGTNAVILPPPPADEDMELEEEAKLPGDFTLPTVENPDLEELANKWFIYDRDQPLVDARMAKEKAMKEKLEKAQTEMPGSTSRPGKNASRSEQILKRCSLYHDLCRKL
jgi:hypothetical protein